MQLTKNLYYYPENGMMDCNTYLIKDKLTIIIDTGLTQFLPSLIQQLHSDGIDPKGIDIIANTHLHGDHSWSNEEFKKISGAKILCHPIQKKFWDATVVQTSQFFGMPAPEFTEDDFLDADRLQAEGVDVELIHAPGHTAESICFYYKLDKALICGDVIFNQNTGRVDLPGGSGDQLRASIDRLSKLDIEYLLPGHMSIVVGKENVKQNFEFIKSRILPYL